MEEKFNSLTKHLDLLVIKFESMQKELREYKEALVSLYNYNLEIVKKCKKQKKKVI